jgi:hypothetical protein
VRDDAAAAARRIVEEVLARHGHGDAPATETVATSEPTPPTEQVDQASERSDRDEPDDSPERPDDSPERPDAETELLAAAGDAATAAAQIARRIVAEALAEAEQSRSERPAGDLEDAQPEVSVHGVPAEGLSAEDEQTVGIEMPNEPTDSDDPPTGGPAPETAAPAEGPDPEPGSAAEIVRRIVADVQSRASTPAEEPATPAEEPAPGAEDHARPDSEATTPPDEDARSPDEDDAPPGGARGPEPDTTAMLEQQRPETATAALPQRHSVAVGAKPEAWADEAPASAPTVVPGRELEGWATPLPPEPSAAAAAQDGAPRTLRWLLASLLGAVALAVLFPLAVAALRALVAMD